MDLEIKWETHFGDMHSISVIENPQVHKTLELHVFTMIRDLLMSDCYFYKLTWFQEVLTENEVLQEQEGSTSTTIQNTAR